MDEKERSVAQLISRKRVPSHRSGRGRDHRSGDNDEREPKW